MTARGAWREAWPALPLLIFLLAVYALPVSRLLLTSLTEPAPGLENYERLLRTPVYASVYWRSLVLAFSVTVATVLIAYPMAWHMTLQSAARQRWLMVLILVPSWTSVLVRSFGWMILLGRHGVLNAFLIGTGLSLRPLRLMFTAPSVGMAMVAILLPYAVIPLYTRMRSLDGALLQAASGLGASGFGCFWHIHLPLCMPALIAGATLTFVLGLGFFITPSLLGGPRDITAAMLILQQFQALLNWGFGAALSTVLLALAALVLLGFAIAGRRIARA